MNPAVVTAVLLLVGVLNTVTGKGAAQWFCDTYYPDEPCGDGWSRIDVNRCAKYFKSPKTFSDAQEHCSTLNADLVSVHSYLQMFNLMCLAFRDDPNIQTFWIGGQRSGDKFTFTDGSGFDYYVWFHGQPDNAGGQEDCIESNFKKSVKWNDANCSEEKSFVCAKKM